MLRGILKTPMGWLAFGLAVAGASSATTYADVPEASLAPVYSQPTISLSDDAGTSLTSSDLLLSADVGVDLWGQSELFETVIWQDAGFESVLATDLSYQTADSSARDERLWLDSTVKDYRAPVHINYDSISVSRTAVSVTPVDPGPPSDDQPGPFVSLRAPWSGRVTVDQSLSPVVVNPAVEVGGYFSIGVATAPAPGAIVLALLGLGLVGAFRAADRRS